MQLIPGVDTVEYKVSVNEDELDGRFMKEREVLRLICLAPLQVDFMSNTYDRNLLPRQQCRLGDVSNASFNYIFEKIYGQSVPPMEPSLSASWEASFDALKASIHECLERCSSSANLSKMSAAELRVKVFEVSILKRILGACIYREILRFRSPAYN